MAITQFISSSNSNSTLGSFLDDIDLNRLKVQSSIEKDHQAEYGQFFTPPLVSSLMASMFTFYKNRIHVLDPGAGVGSLSAAFIARVIADPRCPKEITITAYECDQDLLKYLNDTLMRCQLLCEKSQINLTYKIIQQDFIFDAVNVLMGKDSLFPAHLPNFDYAIINPPYKKINNGSKQKTLLKTIGIDTTNLYSAFVWLTIELLSKNGELVAITPRSFCNGTYFANFRSFLLDQMTIKRIHIFESRDKAFKEGNVLQENIIINAVKGKNQKTPVTITSSDNPYDEDITNHLVEYDKLVDPNDQKKYIRIVPNSLGFNVSSFFDNLPCTIDDLDITASTGKVVDFRSTEFLRDTPDNETIPLIFPNNLVNSVVVWPNSQSKKKTYLALVPATQKLAIPSDYYVLLKRFSSKEEKRRLYAAFYNPEIFSYKRIGLENHINYFHRRYGGLNKEFAKGLTVFLNSSMVDEFFRQFSGHTQVNASDLHSLKYPTKAQLTSIGEKIGEIFPNQEEIDNLITSVLTANSEENIMAQDPIQAKKKVNEALSILHALNVPKTQQNDRSALTLLSLANIHPSSRWQDATENLIGITEMLDFFRDNYGINYAPNTRETVRRQTIHQFSQMGIVIENPDDPRRPINSPKTKYLLKEDILNLIKSYETPNWKGNLVSYVRENPNLQTLQIREREMFMLPVKLPDGEEILLTGGGQNNLIKQIIEEFCPRYTPGGKVCYIGDAGNKLTENEFEYFKEIGFNLDRHGKMPDLIIEMSDKKWLVVIEAVTSHGPIDIKRHIELKTLFGNSNYGLVFLTAFETRKVMNKYLSNIAWETEVWVAESPSHLIHFNGERFLGPYN